MSALYGRRQVPRIAPLKWRVALREHYVRKVLKIVWRSHTLERAQARGSGVASVPIVSLARPSPEERVW